MYAVSYLASEWAVIVTEGPGTRPRLEISAKPFVRLLATTAGFLGIMQDLLGAGHVVGSVLVVDNPKDLRRVLQQFIIDASWPVDYYCRPKDDPPSKQQAIMALQALKKTSRAANNNRSSSRSTSRATRQGKPAAYSATGGAHASSSSGGAGSAGPQHNRATQSSSSGDTVNDSAESHPSAAPQSSNSDVAGSAAPQSSRSDAASDISTARPEQEQSSSLGQQPQKRESRKRQKHTCASCDGKGLKCCAGCRSARYYCEACQAADWPEHKKVCSPKQD